MDIDRVRYFHVFSETGSLVKASEVLHLSQPALSKALKLLEREVGVALLEHAGRGLRLTEAGRAFKAETDGLLKQWLGLPDRLKGRTETAPTRIGSFEVFTTHFLSHFMKRVDLESLELHERRPGHLEAAIAAGQIDIGITYLPIPHSGVEFIEVTKIRMGVFGRADRFGKTGDFSYPFAIPLASAAEGTPSKVIGLDGWPDHKIPRRVKYRVTMMESALELCRDGYAVAYLPEFVVHLHNEKVKSAYALKELESPIPRREQWQSVFLIARQNTTETSLVREIAKSLRQLK